MSPDLPVALAAGEALAPLLVMIDTTMPANTLSWVEASAREAVRRRDGAIQMLPRGWLSECIALGAVRRWSAGLSQITVLDGEARQVVRAAQDRQHAICDDAETSARIIMDPDSGEEAKARAWTDLQVFIHADLKIRPKVAPSAKVAVPRIDPYEIHMPVMRLLLSGGWRERAVWPLAYLRRAARRAEHQSYVRAAQSLRTEDRSMPIDKAAESIPAPDTPCAIGIDAEAFLAAVRATGWRADIEFAGDVEAWISHRAGKASMGEARYRRMLRWLRLPRIRAMARRVGLEPDPSSRSTGVIELPLWTYRPGWERCYRTAEAPALPIPPEGMASVGYEVHGT